MAAQNSAGIQTLLDAEREAQKIVQKAREYRTKRVKDARSEAQKEIEDYRKQKDDEFQKFEKEVQRSPPFPLQVRARVSVRRMLTLRTQHSSGNKAAEEQAEKDTQKELDNIKEIGNKQGGKVVDDLVKAVMEVHPQVPDKRVEV
ncbi:hypothetical protein D0864_00582 [Hortaea werneckii]|uniref:V-type proton ATPase subunit G n=1 Tax=Hortaea werneckii TaxID=91943 RepID=A0A3M7HIB7_HORWE|nr:hypothetical protein D0864_00582 [Hortaea werneckii]